MHFQQKELQLTNFENHFSTNKMDATPILILVYNGWDMVLSNLNMLSCDFFNIFIIDNNSQRDMANEIRLMFPNVNYLRLDQNYGWAGGYNRALQKISLENNTSVFILNSDAVVNAESVRSAVDGLNEHVAAVGSVILEDDGNIIAYDGNFYLPCTKKSPNEINPDRLPVRSVHGAGFALSLDAYRAIGPFYEPYFLYHEEADWCSEAQKKGYEILVDGKSLCYHKGGGSISSEIQEYYMTRNTFIALKRGTYLVGVPNTWLGFVVQGLKMPKGNEQLAAARASGLLDGVFGRFGKRRSSWNPVIRNTLILALKILVLPAHVIFRLTNLMKKPRKQH